MSYELLEQTSYLALIAPSKGMTWQQRIDSLAKVEVRDSVMVEILAYLSQITSNQKAVTT